MGDVALQRTCGGLWTSTAGPTVHLPRGQRCLQRVGVPVKSERFRLWVAHLPRSGNLGQRALKYGHTLYVCLKRKTGGERVIRERNYLHCAQERSGNKVWVWGAERGAVWGSGPVVGTPVRTNISLRRNPILEGNTTEGLSLSCLEPVAPASAALK